ADTLSTVGSLGQGPWLGWLQDNLRGADVVAAQRLEGQVAALGVGTPVGLDMAEWVRVTSARTDVMHAVTGRVLTTIQAATTSYRRAQVRTTVLTIGMVAMVLAATMLLAALGARHLSRRLRALRRGTLHVADTLPAVVAQLDQAQAGTSIAEATRAATSEVVVDGRDEVGATAAAFRQVCQVAVGLA